MNIDDKFMTCDDYINMNSKEKFKDDLFVNELKEEFIKSNVNKVSDDYNELKKVNKYIKK